MTSYLKAILILFLIGFLLIPLCDYKHVITHTTAYTGPLSHPFFFGVLPWWLPLLFGFATLSLGLGFYFFERIFDFSTQQKTFRSIKNSFFWVLLFIFVYALSGCFNASGRILEWILLLFALVFWFYLSGSLTGFFIAALLACLGCAVEILLIHKGVFLYLGPNKQLFGIPHWLFLLYFMGTLSSGNMMRSFVGRDR